MKVTVIVPTFNEEQDLRGCLESIKWADKIFVVDSFSTDKTLEIAREYTDNIVQHEYVNSATQKNWAIPQVETDWIMVLDADERVSDALRDRIQAILKDGTDYDGFYVKRLTKFFGKPIKHCGWGSEYLVRFWRKGKGMYLDRSVHADVKVEGKTGRIEEHIVHDTYKNYDDYFEKFNRYTTWSAQDIYKKGASAGVLNLVMRPIWRFFKMYFLQLGFLDGKHGLVISALSAFTVFTKYAKLWSMKLQGKKAEHQPAVSEE